METDKGKKKTDKPKMKTDKRKMKTDKRKTKNDKNKFKLIQPPIISWKKPFFTSPLKVQEKA